jgi:endonuclease/exonuclease/phosphatase family metal-dependent hydrolase
MKKLLFLGILPFLWVSYDRPIQIKENLNRVSYQTNCFARKLGRDLETVTRPTLSWTKRAGILATLPMTTTFTLAAFPCHVMLTSVSTLIPSPLLKSIQLTPTPNSSRSLTLLSFNGCLREGFVSQYTAGVVPPSEAVSGYPSRSAAIADWIVTESPDIFVGQEFNDPAAVDLIIEKMQKNGYCSFLYDPHLTPLSINCGLFIASKRKLDASSLHLFPFANRYGIAKFARRGTIACTILDDQNKPLIRIYNTHLDAGVDQEYRNKQLRENLLPHFINETIPSILVGDLNFDTAIYKHQAGLSNYTNILEGFVTCNDEGKQTLRGATSPPNIEKIDGIIGNQPLNFSNIKITQVKSGPDILSDHYGVSTTINL